MVIQVNVIIAKETEVAKLALQEGKRDIAILTLKKKKYQEGLLTSTNQQLLNLEELVHKMNFFTLN